MKGKSLVDDEVLWVGLAAIGGAVVLVMNIPAIWGAAAAWLVAHQVLVETNILVPLPGDVGLDMPRTTIALGVVLLLALAARSGLRARSRAREQQRASQAATAVRR